MSNRLDRSVLVLLVALAACGGGGGGSTPTPPPPPPPPTGGGTGDALQAYLAACPTTATVNQAAPCMTGVYEGTTASGSACAFAYDRDGVAWYLADGQSIRADLSVTGSASVYEKVAASNPAGFSLRWSVGIASGNDIDLSYRAPAEPASATGLYIRPLRSGVPACLVTQGPDVAASGAASTANTLGRQWQAPQAIDGGGGLDDLGTEPGFEGGLADDGRVFVVMRRRDGTGRIGVQMVEGRIAGSGAPTWTAPQVLDADAPLAPGALRPRIAVAPTGHAVAAWLAALPCEADSYESSPAGKTCRYLVATRRLAGAGAWEAPQRVRASPPVTAPDHTVRIDAAGNAAIVFTGVQTPGSAGNRSFVALRGAAESGWRSVMLNDFNYNPQVSTPLAQRVQVALAGDGALFAAGQSSSTFVDVARARTSFAAAADLLTADRPHETDLELYALATSGRWAATTTRLNAGPSRPGRPERLALWSPTAQAWLPPVAMAPYVLWGDSALVGLDGGEGDFLLYAGCKVTTWRAGVPGATRSLPAYCGRDRPGGLYAFGRDGDYLGINWAGQPGQWGYYSRTQDRLLKGAPGSGSAAAGDFVLGVASDAIGAGPTQLLLAPGGLALALGSNSFDALPSPAAPNGTPGAQRRLWAVVLR